MAHHEKPLQVLVYSKPNNVDTFFLSTFNQPLKAGSIANGVDTLKLSSYNQQLKAGSIPNGVTTLDLPSYNQPLELESIPNSVTSLSLSSYNQPLLARLILDSVGILFLESYNQPLISGSIPNSVYTLDLSKYNQPITPGSIPNGVSSLKLSTYNHPLTPGLIPNKVETLDLSTYNQPLVPGSIPNSVETLDLSTYNQPLIPGSIPNSVETLELSTYNQPLVPGSIPNGVSTLKLSSYDQLLIAGSIPNNVETLELSTYNQPLTAGLILNRVNTLNLSKYNQPLTAGSIPNSVSNLDLSTYNQSLSPGIIPNSVYILKLSSYNQSLSPGLIPNRVRNLDLSSYNLSFESESIPNSVTNLDLSSYNQSLKPGLIPNSVDTLNLSTYNQPLTAGLIPNGVHTLILSSYNQIFSPGLIPSSVGTLILSSYNQPLTLGSIHNRVYSLNLSSYNQPLTAGLLPNNLDTLNLSAYNQPLTTGVIPNSVYSLDLLSYNQPLAPGLIPSGVSTLKLPTYNQPLTSGSILNVKTLELSTYNQPITPGLIPNSVHTLNLSSYNQPLNIYGAIPFSVTSLNLMSYKHKLNHGVIPKSVHSLILATGEEVYEIVSISDDIEIIESRIYPKNCIKYIEGAIPISNLLEQFHSENELLIIVNEIIKSIKTIHDNNIIHFDIKCENILLLHDENGKRLQNNFIKITGFKYSQIDSNLKLKPYYMAETETHMAPEMKLKTGNLSYKSDIWSLGCTLIELAGGDVKELDINGIPIIPDHLSNHFKNIIQHCLQLNPNVRFNINELNNYVISKGLTYKESDPVYKPKNIIKLESFNEAITVQSIFYGVKKLELQTFNQSFEHGSIPDSVEYLILQSYNQPLIPYALPSTLKYLIIPSYNNTLIKNSIPSSVIYLKLNDFNEKIDLYTNMGRFLDFGCRFNFEENEFPNSGGIQTLRSGFQYIEPINQRNIPLSVTDLQLYNYNIELLPNSIPPTIITLTLGSNFTHFESLSNLPSSIINLKFETNENFNLTEIIKHIPTTITSININNNIIKIRKPQPINNSKQNKPQQQKNILNQALEHKNNDWEIISTLGKGSFGIVFLAKKVNGVINGLNISMCAIKKIDKTKIPSQNEIEILDKLKNHEHSIKYYGYGIDENDSLYIYMEYIESSISIANKLMQLPNKRFQEDKIKSLIFEIAIALKKIHESGIIHRDIKGDHIFLIEDKSRNNETKGIKFIDFGLSKQIGEDSKYNTLAGTNSHMAPEVKLQNRQVSPKSDVYSLGCAMLEMVGINLNKCKSGDQGIPSIPTNLSFSLQNIIQHCLQFNLPSRYSLDDLIAHLSNQNQINGTRFGYTIPPHIKRLELETNEPLELGAIDNDVQYLSLPFYDQPIGKRSIPSSVKYLLFNKLNQYLECDCIPESVEYLDLGNEFDIEKNGRNIPFSTILFLRCGFNFKTLAHQKILPESVTNLQLYNYNIEIKRDVIPQKVKSLTLGSNFKDFESLSNLPSSVIDLTFGVSESFDENQLTKEIEKIQTHITSIIINGKQRRN
ncbi:hypothetical protein RB653_010401 [Dictyostelium firmibasis]|uniref:Protein kinase domain-containing protein n=1 Tax=Dictyostelium firmibasis TaxID=79012 RepID=A0AAN7TZ88_9MYCE